MCGIGGCLGDHASSGLMKKMAALVRHRGPDDYGEFTDSGIALFNNRLSIIDVEGGRQPIFNETEDVVIVYNGEIYNFIELRRDLEKKEHKFRTNSDTEVIVHGYEEYGTNIFGMLDSMFAIALWDKKQKRLLLARDRVGIKPLYYTKIRDGDLVFCSEVKGILAHPEVNVSVDQQALYQLIALYYIPFELTLFNGIYKIPPGHYYDSSSGNIARYWTAPNLRAGFVPSVEEVRSALEQSVKRQLISDVEVGSFLSGGLDTSTIVAFASKHYRGKLKTFCMGFGHEDDELDDARRVAEHFGTDHHSFIISDKSTLELYPKMIWHSEQPKVNTYSWFVNEYAGRYVKVCLSGLGGDELFFGYPTSSRFLVFQRAQSMMKVPGLTLLGGFTTGKKKTLLRNLKNRAFTYLTTVSPVFGIEDNRVFRYSIDQHREDLLNRTSKTFFSDREEFVQQAVKAEFNTKLPNDFLSIDDAMSMAHSLENRVPLIDNQILDLLLPVSYRYNFEGGMGKMLLRKAMKDILPENCFRKPKQGFSLNLTKWWPGELGEEIRRVVPESAAVKQYFDVESLKRLIPSAGESYSRVSLLWHVYAFHIWHDLFVDKGKESLEKFSISTLV